MSEINVSELAKKAATTAAIGAVAGVTSGLANASAPHAHVVGAGVANASSSFFNSATTALKNHRGVGAALGAGTSAVVGHGVVATVVVAAAPVVAAVALAGGALWGLSKVIDYFDGKR